MTFSVASGLNILPDILMEASALELIPALLIVVPIMTLGILVGAELVRRITAPILTTLLAIVSKRKQIDGE